MKFRQLFVLNILHIIQCVYGSFFNSLINIVLCSITRIFDANGSRGKFQVYKAYHCLSYLT